MFKKCRTIPTDVLIVGAGAAGGRAAIEVDKNNVKTLLIDKGLMGKAGATPTAFLRASWGGHRFRDVEARFKRILQVGCYLNDQDLLWLGVQESPELLNELSKWAVRAEDSFSDGLNNEIARHPGITVLEYVIITKLLTYNGKIVGATGLDIRSGDFILFKTKAVILAAGGYGELYRPSECTPLDIRIGEFGDGHALAYQAGAEMVNMEMMQWQQLPDNPKWMVWSRHVFGEPSPTSFRVVSLTGPYYDKDGKVCISTEEIASMPVGCAPPRVMDYNPNLINRIYEEMMRGPVYVDLVEKVEDPSNVKFSLADKMLRMDLMKLPRLKVVLGSYTGQGGSKINEKGETNIPGLYAVGECCGNLYGAHRPSGLMNTTLVFGRRAGYYAAEYAKTVKQGDIELEFVSQEQDRISGFLDPKPKPIAPIDVKKKIWKITGDSLYILRNEKGLKKAIEEIKELRRKELPRIQVVDIKRFNLEWIEAIEVSFMLDVAEMIARSALLRTESRGCHQRTDFPKMDNINWLKHTLLRKEDDKIKLSKVPVKMTRYKPPSLDECLKGGEPIPLSEIEQ